MKTYARIALLAAIGTVAPNISAQADLCGVQAKITIRNDWPGIKLTGVGIIHRVGQSPEGGVESFFWKEDEIFSDKRSDYSEVSSAARRGGVDFAKPDYWLVIATYRRHRESKDTVFVLNPHDGRPVGEAIVEALRATPAKDVKTFLDAVKVPTTGAVGALLDPVGKVVTALLAQQGASLVNYGRADFACEDNGGEVKLNVGNGKRDPDWAYIQMPSDNSPTKLGQLVPSLINADKVMEVLKAKLEEKKKEDDKNKKEDYKKDDSKK